jgi:hypothetical protein
VSSPAILRTYAEDALSFANRSARLAAWINAYNRLVADGIRTLGLRETVWDVPDFFDRIALRTGALVFSANDIEHGVLRGNRPDPLSGVAPFPGGDARRRYSIAPVEPRIHFALNCGARSCPPVRAYRADTLEDALEEAARGFVNREVTLDGGAVRASPIFGWFRSDFADGPDGLVGFLCRYLADGAARQVLRERGEAALSWRSYDWRVTCEPWVPDA